jgi:inner membrane protein
MSQENMQFMKRVSNSAITRLLVIGVLVGLLLIPMEMIEGVIRERAGQRESVIREISSKWGDEQTIGGPVLSIPYKIMTTDNEGKAIWTIYTAHFLPDQLTLNGTVKPEIRYRGIYEAVLYASDLQIAASFKSLMPAIEEMGINVKDVLLDKAFVSIGISDLRGLKDNNMVGWNDTQRELNSGIGGDHIMPCGVNTRVPVTDIHKEYQFSMHLTLNGSGTLSFLPLGKTTMIHINSPWKSPSFSGAFLPDMRTVNDRGFDAVWKTMNLNRNYPQYWKDYDAKIMQTSLGVSLFTPVDEYQKTMRSAKYALLFILLTFVVFFITEIMQKNKVHPIQYLMVGFAISLFYFLLLSISEHSNFMTAYLISSIATVVLVSAYTKSMLKSLPMAAVVAALLAFLYGFLYVILQLEDYALLMGGIGLFAILSIIMFVTRKIDWYGLTAAGRQGVTKEIE